MLQNFETNLSVSVKNALGGGVILWFSTEIAVYLGNGTRGQYVVAMDH